ncbi:hypothetical protein [Bacteroides faecalis]|nr:hypothetical protein [Bacteroides faecalis]
MAARFVCLLPGTVTVAVVVVVAPTDRPIDSLRIMNQNSKKKVPNEPEV